MKTSQFTEEQIAYVLRQAEVGKPVGEVCRRPGVSEHTFYRWKANLVQVGVTELSKLCQLEEENRRLKQLVADLSLDKHVLQEVIHKDAKGHACERTD